jgi:RDD family
MTSALLNTTSEPEFARGQEIAQVETAAPRDSAEDLRAQVAERLAAHRRRRGGEASQPSMPEPRQGNTRSAQIAAAVAHRYAHTQSYRAFLAAEAERSIQQARAAAEVAALNAQAVAAAQQRLLEAFDEHTSRQTDAQAAEVREHQHQAETARNDAARTQTAPTAVVEQNLWPDLEPAATPQQKTQHRRPQAHARETSTSKMDLRAPLEPRTSNLEPGGGLTVRLYEDSASVAHVNYGHPHHAAIAAHTNRREERNDAEAWALDEEIAFRQAPVFEEPAGPPVPLPANLIEFPRQLVASRKARPRYAEGPLRDENEAAAGDGQLRIFEVDPAQISTEPAADTAETSAAQWTSIWLDTPPEAAHSEAEYYARHDYSLADSSSDAASALPMASTPAAAAIQPASIQRRVLASAVNTAILSTGTLAFAATFLAVSAHGIAWTAGGSRLQALRQIGASIAAQTGLQPLDAAAIGAGACAFLVLLYHALFFWFSEATPGMRCARIGLCTFDDENPTRRAIRRRLGAMLLSACPLGFGFAFAALDEQRLTWHDRITKMYLRSY